MEKQLRIEYDEAILRALELSPEEFAREARLLLAVKLHESGKLSADKAAKLAVVDMANFLRQVSRLASIAEPLQLSEATTAAQAFKDGAPGGETPHPWSELMAQLGSATFDLLHRLKNELGAARNLIRRTRRHLANKDRESSQSAGYLQRAEDAIHEVLKLSSEILDELAREYRSEQERPVRPLKPVSVCAVLEEIRANLHSHSPSIVIGVDCDKTIAPIDVTESDLKDILRNLVINAIEAMPNGGTITLSARSTRTHIEIEVADTGPGIDEALSSKIFDLGYSVKGSSGVGLWSARQKTQRNGGKISLENLSESGAVFKLCFPRS